MAYVMKRTLSLAAIVLIASCSQEAPLPSLPATPSQPHRAAVPTPRYIALPGQAAVPVNSDVDAAFDQQVAAYNGQAAAVQVPTAPQTPTVDITTTPTTPPDGMQTGLPAAAPQPDAAIQTAADTLPPAPAADITATNGGNMNYKVRITNDTPGRIFVEAQDGAGTIYPCGFMESGRTFTTPLENAAPIQGAITIVVRDPDQPGAPEIRRYKVDPPASNYNGKAIAVNILKGGRYMASVDGQVYYATPVPDEPEPQPNAPAPAPEQPAPAPAPAPGEAPAQQ